ncbi:MAG: SMC family ATPase [Actinomycetota bacterium]|nr:SMC family ATPase [Actinomycetota bacterium]
MRPERLELEGFTAFREPTVLDLEDADLFALTGPTGSGKSSLIDAIVFALYGCVPRYDDRRRVAPAISEGRVEARVRLDFSVVGRRYTAVRVVRATRSGATTKEARLERALDDGTTEVLAGDADGLTDAVTGLLGLTYEHFTTCVVLPQGEFARFLHHKPRDRQALLVELLDLGIYERMAGRARERAVAERTRLEVANQRLADLAHATAERREELTGRAGVLDELIEQATAALARRREIAAGIDEAQTAQKTADEAITLLERARAPEDTMASATELTAAREARRDAAEQAEHADDDIVAAEAGLVALPGRAALEQVVAAHRELERQRRLVAKGTAARTDAAAAHAEAVAATDAARTALERRREEVAAARTKDLAAAVAEGLEPGDECPVCGHEITDLDHAAGADLAAANEAERRAASALGEQESALAAASAELARVEGKLEEVTTRRDELAERLTDAPTEDELETELAAVGAAEQRLADARTASAAARQRLTQADRILQRAETAARRAREVLDAARDALAPLSPPPLAREDLAEDWRLLGAWADERRPHLVAERDAADARRRSAEEAAAELDAGLRSIATAGGVTGIGDGVRDALVAERARVAAALDRLETDLARRVELDADRAVAAEAEVVASQLGQHLRANAFQKWVLDEALERLVAGATGILWQLSGGAYSLTLEPRTSNFAVIDHVNADAVRSARTLSGGETFLASLALALALAEQVVDLASASTVRLESIFLDEGFGTLDPDALDTVAAAIEELGSTGRTVGVVTHVRDLAERLPVRFEVHKGPAGAGVERVAR